MTNLENHIIIEKNLSLDKESNPEYFSIINEYQFLFTKINKINNDIIAIKIAKLFFWKSKARLKEIEKEIKAIEKEYIEWDKKASSFIHYPSINIKESEDQYLIFSHNINILCDIRNKLSEGYLSIVLVNYYRVRDRQNNQINFIIAIASCIIAIVGLLISLYLPTQRIIDNTTSFDNIPSVNSVISTVCDTSNIRQADTIQMQNFNIKDTTIKSKK